MQMVRFSVRLALWNRFLYFLNGWRNLGNGALSKVAVTAGFRVILTRDRLFGESAAKALQLYPDLCVVILKIPQSKAEFYLASFKDHWQRSPICIVPGTVIEWLNINRLASGNRYSLLHHRHTGSPCRVMPVRRLSQNVLVGPDLQ